MQGNNTLESDNIIIYGHNMKNGTMFSDITKYRNETFCTEHPTIEFETGQGLKLYSVFAVVQIKNNDSWYSLVNQLERSSTSIGANIHEANYAHSKADFVAKFQIALKECYETEYWLELFVKSELLDREIAKELYNQCGTIRRMLIASINTAKGENK